MGTTVANGRVSPSSGRDGGAWTGTREEGGSLVAEADEAGA
jgi:hypothetical protein